MTGFEPATPLPDSGENRQSGAVCEKCAGCATNVLTESGDPRLFEVVARWDELPEEMRVAIDALVKAALSP